MKDYKFEGVLILKEFKICYKKWQTNRNKVGNTMEKPSPVGNRIVSRNYINLVKNGLDFGAQRSPDT